MFRLLSGHQPAQNRTTASRTTSMFYQYAHQLDILHHKQPHHPSQSSDAKNLKRWMYARTKLQIVIFSVCCHKWLDNWCQIAWLCAKTFERKTKPIQIRLLKQGIRFGTLKETRNLVWSEGKLLGFPGSTLFWNYHHVNQTWHSQPFSSQYVLEPCFSQSFSPCGKQNTARFRTLNHITVALVHFDDVMTRRFLLTYPSTK